VAGGLGRLARGSLFLNLNLVLLILFLRVRGGGVLFVSVPCSRFSAAGSVRWCVGGWREFFFLVVRLGFLGWGGGGKTSFVEQPVCGCYFFGIGESPTGAPGGLWEGEGVGGFWLIFLGWPGLIGGGFLVQVEITVAL